MKPARFAYTAPDSIEGVLDVLDRFGDGLGLGAFQAGPGCRLQPVVIVVALRHAAFFADHGAFEAV